MSGDCLDPCKYSGHFAPPQELDQKACDHAAVHGTNCEEFLQCSPVCKNEANKSCLHNPPADGPYSPEMQQEQVLTDVPEPPKIKSPELSNSLGKADFAITEYKRADESGNPPCYMPQPNDDLPNTDNLKPMGPVGPWATGKVDWSPLAGLTGTRPVVDRYSITRFSTNEWRAKNKEVLGKTFDIFEQANQNDTQCKNTMVKVYALTDKTQAESTKRIRDRAQLVNKWKLTLERAIKAMADEITTLEEQRLRLKQSLSILKTPEAIASECIERRSCRPGTELVRDKPEEELINELALIAEIRRLLNKTLDDITSQQIENRTARNRMEYDWSDKKDAYEIETINLSLNNLSTTTMFRPGAVRFPEEQSSEEYWMHFTQSTLEECENCRQKSVALRSTLDAILLNAARDLRNQADVVEKAFTVRIGCMQENLNRLENELRDCLCKLAACEIRIEKISRGLQGLDNAMKVAQTRLDNRNQRPHVENCRDRTQMGLVDEVKQLQDSVASSALTQAQNIKNLLMQTRGNLELDIMLKRRTIKIDRDRCMLLRSHFPSANALSGS